MSKQFIYSTITDLPPVAGSDHSAQIVMMIVDKEHLGARMRQCANHKQLGKLLSQLDHSTIFMGCFDVDDFGCRITETLLNVIACSYY